MIKITWLGPVTDLGPYQAKPGVTYTLPDEVAEHYIKEGLAERLKPATKKREPLFDENKEGE